MTYTFMILFVSSLMANASSWRFEQDYNPRAGAKVFRKYKCDSCHGKTGNGLADIRSANAKYNDDDLKRYIRNPSSFGNTRMPVYQNLISADEIEYLVQYVKSLGKSR